MPGAGRVASDDLPSPPSAAVTAGPAAADAGSGAERARAPAGARGAALRAVRRRLAGGDLRDAAGRRHLPVLDADDVPDPRRQAWRRPRAACSAHPSRLRQARAARRAAERAVVLGRVEAEGPGEVDVVLPVRDPRRVQPLHRRLDGGLPRERPARDGADRAGRRAAADHTQDPDAARRPRRAAARQAGRVSPRGPRDHEDAQPPVHLQRQPLLGVELQDPEVPARVPRPVRRRSSTPALTAARSSTGTTTPTATPGSG